MSGVIRPSYVRPLRDVTRADLADAGSKAANLGELAKAGFPVPDGYVLTTSAFDAFLAANGLADASIARGSCDVEALPLPSPVAEAIRWIASAFGDVPLAVRSSAIAEDLAGASYAGQYETVLDVKGADALTLAVRRCWASAFGERAAAYRPGAVETRETVAPAMAVLVQRLVPADAAGVAFTANPVTGDRDEILVSAVRGLGERLVSGQASPDEWLVRAGQAIQRSSPEGAVNPAQVQAVAEMARHIALTLGCPQDVEWALSGGAVYLLQARPITSLPANAPAAPEPVVPPGFWELNTTLFTRPLTPMTRSVELPLLNAAFQRSIREVGALVETFEWREIGGWVYQGAIPLGRRHGPPPPSWLMPLLIRIVPSLRQRVKRSVKHIRADWSDQIIDRWHREWKPALISRIAEFRAVDPPALSEEGLDQHLSRTIELAKHALDVHVALHMAMSVPLARLVFACRDTLGWDERRTIELLAGLSVKSTEPARRLAELARMAGERPLVRGLLEHVSEATIARLVEVDREFAEAFARYQREFGCRALQYEIDYPTMAESPTLVLALIRDQLARGYDPEADESAQERRRGVALAAARAALSSRPSAEGEQFERALSSAQRAYPVREDMELYTVSAPLAVARYAGLEIGRRLAERDVIANPADIFFLEYEEARAALHDRRDRRVLVQRRRAERAWVEAHPGPATYGKAPTLPPLDALPPEARFFNEALMWYGKHALGQRRVEDRGSSGATLTGLGVSPGRYSGRVCIVMNESQFGKLRAGDVLVCPITTPVWSVLFAGIGALVTDTGGILSHAAIIAREYRVPGVVATGNATKVLRDGQLVIVDGSAGTVEV